MERKWEWIANRLGDLVTVAPDVHVRRKLEILHAYAAYIDARMRELYGDDAHTPKWVQDYDMIQRSYRSAKTLYKRLIEISIVAYNAAYCYACMKHRDDGCADCKLAEAIGICGDRTSDFWRFNRKLERLTAVVRMIEAGSEL